MKFTLSWLKDHLDTTASVDEISARLVQLGLEVEAIDDPAAKLAKFTIARVMDAKPHPNADKLRVLKVEIAPGQPPVEVICGAPNARTGLIGVFAPLGAYIPGTGLTLEKKPVRGIISNGMMLSEREMQLSDAHDGIVDLDEKLKAKIGQRYVDVLGLSDPVIEVKLTPNRPDCTGVRGIARDLAASGLGTLKPEVKLKAVEGTVACPIDVKLQFTAETADACPMFGARYIKGISNGAAPDWMRRRLEAIGQKTISAVVDVTNYIGIDRGRPLHVFDADKIKGAIVARLGKAGEKFLGLNGQTYMVDATMCVIADDTGALGLGGILGGESTGATAETKNILIECAYFDPLRTAQTGRKANVQTDARYRFERGVDPAFVEAGLDLATHFMMEVAGGAPSKRVIAGQAPITVRQIAFDPQRVAKIANLDVPALECKAILERLGFKVDNRTTPWTVIAPTWRPDIGGAADLVEEIARIRGLETIPSVALPRLHSTTKAVLTDLQRKTRRARRTLAGRGFVEAITWSFITDADAKHFGGGAEALILENPISSDMSSMRPSLLPGLLAAVARNRNRGHADVALFEVGQAYRGDRPADQFMAAAGVRAGTAHVQGAGRFWRGAAADIDLFDVKADVVALLASLGVDAAKAQVTRDAPAWFHPGQSATLRLGPKVVLAHFGALHPATLKALDVSAPAAAFEVFLSALPADKKKSRTKPPLTVLPLLPVKRDFAFIVDTAVAAGDVVKAAQATDKVRIAHVSVFDIYEGKGVPDGKKSVAIEVTLQPTERAMTDAEIEAVAQKLVADVTKLTGAAIRG